MVRFRDIRLLRLHVDRGERRHLGSQLDSESQVYHPRILLGLRYTTFIRVTGARLNGTRGPVVRSNPRSGNQLRCLRVHRCQSRLVGHRRSALA